MNINFEKIYDWILVFGPKVIGAILVLIFGLWIIKMLTRGFRKILTKRKIDTSLQPFLVSLINILLKTLLVITVISMLGVEMTSFIAILGAAGLALGLALSGTLQNFAGGVMILIFKPFKVGEFIEAQGYSGIVKEIQVFNTVLNTPDNKVIIMPNGGLSTISLINFSRLETRRVDFTFGIGYQDDIDKARKVIQSVLVKNDKILKDPANLVVVSELGDNSVNFTVRVWVITADYWEVFFDTTEKVKKAFDKEGISIPFPQRDVHLYSVNN